MSGFLCPRNMRATIYSAIIILNSHVLRLLVTLNGESLAIIKGKKETQNSSGKTEIFFIYSCIWFLRSEKVIQINICRNTEALFTA